jgi:hypothetical protein
VACPPRAYTITLFTGVIITELLKVSAFGTASLFQASLTFSSKAGAYYGVPREDSVTYPLEALIRVLKS